LLRSAFLADRPSLLALASVVRRDGRSAKVTGWALKPASSQCNVRPCETRYSTTDLRAGECGQILETLKGQPPTFCKLQIYGLVENFDFKVVVKTGFREDGSQYSIACRTVVASTSVRLDQYRFEGSKRRQIVPSTPALRPPAQDRPVDERTRVARRTQYPQP